MQPASARTRDLLALIAAVAAIGVGWVLSVALSGYTVYLAISMVTATISILGLGIVTGSAGIIALCQLTFGAIGAWVVTWLNQAEAPGGFILWLIAGGAVASLAGIIIGLPALRLRGVNLAVVTLGFAAAFDVLIVQTQFPGQKDGLTVERPALFANDRGYFFFTIIVLVICASLVYLLQRSRVGSSWKAVAFSERGTAAVGQSVRLAKLSAFAVSAALGGVAGGLLAGQVGIPYASSFTPIQSLALYILAVMSGAYLIDMAIFGGVLWVLVPELLKRWGIPQDWAFVVFGVLGIQALTSGANLGEAIRSALRRRFGRRLALPDPESVTTTALDAVATVETSSERDDDAAPVFEVSNLGVQFGTLKALDDVSLAVAPRTIMGLIGPNGAGKSTFVDAVSGFLPQHTGTVTLAGENITRHTPVTRARDGLRRTFQQDRVPPQLTVEAYVRFVARRRLSTEELRDALAFMGCPEPEERLSNVDVGTRRLIEVTAAVLAGPKVLILDEPAAGLSHDEHVQFGHRLTRIPSRFNTAIIIIEHDLDLVRTVCTELTVLDFGKVLAQGSAATVLDDPAVIAAYMGDTEVTS